ncbi:MAG TPA: hypothetical protein VEV41_27500 [Terriglobales bacterium]|nr:hypothetical protein [Terriglobales bacterium]
MDLATVRTPPDNVSWRAVSQLSTRFADYLVVDGGYATAPSSALQ